MSNPIDERFSAPPQKLLLQAHKVVLNSASPINKNTHPHPMIFLRGSTNQKSESMNSQQREVISKMLFGSECFITRCARNIFFTVDIPVMLCECFLGLELFATDITNKVRSHYCEFWFLQLLWSSSGECLFQTDFEAVS